MGMPIHIGEEILKLSRKQRIGATALAKMIDKSRQNVNDIFTRETIDTQLLLVISKALNFNFFSLYTEEYDIAKGIESMLLTDVAPKPPSDLDRCKAELDAARREIEDRKNAQVMAQKIITLLEDKLETITGKRTESEELSEE